MATAFKQVKNNSKSTLASSINSSVTSLTVTTGQGSRFPTPGNSFWATIWDKATYADPRDDPNGEIVLVTARSTDTLTVTRGQLGSTASSHASGQAVEMLLLDQHFTDVYGAINALEAGGGGGGSAASSRTDTLVTPYPDAFSYIDTLNTAPSDYYGAGTLSADSTQTVDGGGSFKIVLPSGGGIAGGVRAGSSKNWSNKNFSIWVRSTNWSQVNELQIIAMTGGSFSDSVGFRLNLKQYLVAPTNNEWIQIIFNREQFTTLGAGDWADIQNIIYRATATGSNTPSVWFDNFQVFEQAPQGFVSIDFDDGYSSSYDAANYMTSKGLTGTFHIIPSLLGTAGYMTEAQVDDLARRGWDISGHGATNLATLYATSPATAEADVKASKEWLNSKAYKGGDIYAYPEGVNNTAIRNIVGKYYSAARDVIFISQPAGYIAPLNIHSFAPIESTTTADINARVADTLTKGTWQVLSMHKIVTTPASGSAIEYSTANFQTVIDNIISSGAICLPKSQVIKYLGLKSRYLGGSNIVTTGGDEGDVLTQQSDGSFAPEPSSGGTPYSRYDEVGSRAVVVEDFLNAVVGSIFGSTVSGTNAAAVIENPFTYDGIGIVKLTTGSTATGSAYVGTTAGTATSVIFGGSGLVQRAKLRAAVGALSTSSEEFTVRQGFLDAGTGQATDGAYFEYDRTVSVNWQIVTASNSTRTRTDTGIAVDTGYHKFEVVVSGGTAEFFIDNVSVGTQSTNLPSGSSRSTGVGGGILKSVGTGYTYYRIDYMAFDATVSRA